MNERLCKYCGKKFKVTTSKSNRDVCEGCKYKRRVVKEFYAITEPLRELSRQRKARLKLK